MVESQTFIGWEFITEDRASAASELPSRQAELSARPEVTSAVLFDVVDGDGAVLCLYDVACASAEDAAAILAGHHSTAPMVDDILIYREVFRSPDARSLASSDRYLFAVRADIEPPDDAELERWYNEVHVPDVASAGLERARRYHSAGGPPKYLATYEIASPEVMQTEAIKQVRGFHEFTPYVKDIERWILQRRREGADAGS